MEPYQNKVKPIFHEMEEQDESTRRIAKALKTLFFLAMLQVLAGFAHILAGSVMYVFISSTDIRGLSLFPFSSWIPFWAGVMSISAGFIGIYASRQTPLITNVCMKRWVFNHNIQSSICNSMSVMALIWAIVGMTKCGNGLTCNTATTVAIAMTLVMATFQAIVNSTSYGAYFFNRQTYGMSKSWCKPYEN
ncbi:uncharacterized protein LOC106173737 isoform X2 [Lingula anatina]|uniref:Uncharacterized protein LOC106173737 isoform X2 n=1 Tax=Lingula anatina TaxID=7574 RepID=A0A1S3JJ31_LINAN|nr:uncharacterized protein LOC106173737 isoform X2 [Lingula anatina]|eukprot:XP_013410420.1 uncharacterized protein LOC106173737 isoform X2 [Lingula anatina]